jgi:hypothetical protein
MNTPKMRTMIPNPVAAAGAMTSSPLAGHSW